MRLPLLNSLLLLLKCCPLAINFFLKTRGRPAGRGPPSVEERALLPPPEDRRPSGAKDDEEPDVRGRLNIISASISPVDVYTIEDR